MFDTKVLLPCSFAFHSQMEMSYNFLSDRLPQREGHVF